ncbi:MAG TPA: DUF3024 domain-containing protein [Opitutaceae bacterium]|jgi:hypothetical protein|nr:MAG: hypothetical protein BWX86_02535 [Verrucomicrobia bacterium ADurb.Bin122]HOG94160.1 DUF3024 domain-containing protein [Opitutaceae bacterium]HPG17992.1 DUF3024 domain-containing protein [Opitutaceae bacterium]HPN99796.1 DUF3024 domain-containing protein [Opitutaceae bacterium]
MAFTEDEIATHTATLEREFWSKRRPPLHLREMMREGQRIEGQSIELFYVRPLYCDPTRHMEESIVKLTYVRTTRAWRIFWQRADLKWHRYAPHPEAPSLSEALRVIDADAYACFFG